MELQPLTKKYHTETIELKSSIVSFLTEKMKNGTEKEKMEISLVCVKSRLFDESTNIKTDTVNFTIKEHGTEPSPIQSEQVAEDSSQQ